MLSFLLINKTSQKEKKMRKILAISSDLGLGGAEKFLTYLLNYLEKNDEFDLELLLIRGEGNVYLSHLKNNIKTTSLNFDAEESLRQPKIVKLLYKILIIRPDILFINNNQIAFFITIFAPILKLFGIKLIWRLTLLQSANCANRSWLYKQYFKYTSRFYSRLITQSNDMTNDLINNWGIKQSQITQINNPVDVEQIQAMSMKYTSVYFDKKYKNYVMVGRLLPQKGYDILIDRISNFSPLDKIRIYIIGKGTLQKELEDKIQNRTICDKIFLLGYQSNPYAIMKQADGLILSSRHEGFPNVLLEANALGIPIFVNRCPGGINEIIIEKLNGISCDMYSQKDFNKSFKEFQSIKFCSDAIISSVSKRYGF